MKHFSLKSNRNVLGFAIALVVGGLSFFAARHQLDAQAVAVKAQFEAENRKAGILVVSRDMQPGDILTMQHVAQRLVPVKYTPSQAMTSADLDKVVGQRVLTAMKPGDPILLQSLENAGYMPFSTELADGRRAITFPVDEVNSFSGLLAPGDVIDLLYSIESRRSGTGGPAVSVRPFLQQVRVLATGTTTRRQKTRDEAGVEQEVDREFATVTLHVAPDEAQKIILAERTGTLTAMLRNPHDQAVISEAAMTSDSLVAPPKSAAHAGGRTIELIVGNGSGALRYSRIPVARN
jgi:pilus assembly protein CpaB